MTPSDLNRFWSKVNKETSNGCWEWTAFVDKHGYPRFNLNGTIVKAHQISALLYHGDRKKGLCVCHKCDNRKCVNPDHLFYATQSDNLKDMYDKKRNKQPKGIHAGKSKLTEEQVKEIRKIGYSKSSRELGKLYGVTHSSIQKIIRLESYKEVS